NKKVYAATLARYSVGPEWRPSLRACLMALPDLLIAHHITGKQRYMDEYRKVIARFSGNPEPPRDTRPYSLERVARVNHSSEGQADRKSTRLNSSHVAISYAVFCLKKKNRGRS